MLFLQSLMRFGYGSVIINLNIQPLPLNWLAFIEPIIINYSL